MITISLIFGLLNFILRSFLIILSFFKYFLIISIIILFILRDERRHYFMHITNAIIEEIGDNVRDKIAFILKFLNDETLIEMIIRILYSIIFILGVQKFFEIIC